MQFPWILKKPELEEDLILTLNLLCPELHLNYFKIVNFYTNQDSIDRPGCTYPYYCHGNHMRFLDQDWLKIIWVNLISKLVYELIKQNQSNNQYIFHFKISLFIRGCQFGMQGPQLCAKPRHFCKVDVATSRIAFLDLTLHVLQVATSNSNNWGRSVLQNCTWHPLLFIADLN